MFRVCLLAASLAAAASDPLDALVSPELFDHFELEHLEDFTEALASHMDEGHWEVVVPHRHSCSEIAHCAHCPSSVVSVDADVCEHHHGHENHGHDHSNEIAHGLDGHALLESVSVAALRAVADATEAAVHSGPTTWSDVEKFLHLFTLIDSRVVDAFPGSLVVSDLAQTSYNVLAERGFTAENTLFSASVCPDEINHVYHNLSMIQMFTQTWGESFHMGGLAGVPFSGQTGFGAFSAHVPDHGNLFILFAPHIGISPAGEFGLYARDGQSADSGHTCGAAVGAHIHINSGMEVPDFTHLGQFPYDYQQQWIISQLATKMDIINAAENKMVELSKQMYYIIENFIANIVSTKNVPGAVILLGGVHVNTPTAAMEDFFWPVKFEIHRRESPDVVEDLLLELRSDLRSSSI